mgnify:CR=1 FL=1
MPQVTFGVASMKKPTPPALKIIFKTIVFLAALWAFLNPQLGVAEALANTINKWTLIGLGLVRFIIQFFGLDYDVDNTSGN